TSGGCRGSRGGPRLGRRVPPHAETAEQQHNPCQDQRPAPTRTAHLCVGHRSFSLQADNSVLLEWVWLSSQRTRLRRVPLILVDNFRRCQTQWRRGSDSPIVRRRAAVLGSQTRGGVAK